MQSAAMVTACMADGTSLITETVFENRFMLVPELVRMGASVRVQGNTAVVEGIPWLKATQVEAPDLRAGAALVLRHWAQREYPLSWTLDISAGGMRICRASWRRWARRLKPSSRRSLKPRHNHPFIVHTVAQHRLGGTNRETNVSNNSQARAAAGALGGTGAGAAGRGALSSTEPA